MAYLGMYAPPDTIAPPTVEARETRWVRASRGGIWHRSIALGDLVKPRQPLGFISDTFGDKPVQVRSPLEGLVIGHGQNPLVNQGDALVHIARVQAEAPPDPLPDLPDL
jgi:predicted deacylase